ncbi:MAG: DUF5723 family protein [Candidatus Krumholzibacteriia bacterium]
MSPHPPVRLPRALSFGLLSACLALGAPSAHGLTTDARRLGMGQTHMSGGRELSGLNVAYQSMPSRRGAGGLVIPIPLGLVQLATDFPSLDPEDADFSVTRLANLALNPPFFLELTEPSDLNGDISIYVARNEFSILFEDAQELLPQKPLEVGSVWTTPMIGLNVMGARAYASPVVFLEGEVAFDDAFYGVLAQGEPLLPNSTYRFDAGGESMAGMSFNFGYSAPVDVDARGNGLYAGAYVKYLMGFTMGKADTRFTMSTSDTIFGSSNPLDVGYEATVRYASFGRIGNGLGLDIGAAYRTGNIDFGIGLRDLASSIHWSRTQVERAWLDEATNEIVTETVETDTEYTQKIPMQTTFNVSWRGTRTILAADITTSSLSTNLHLGAERQVGPVAVRGGLLTDDDASLQVSWGFGFGLSSLWFDLGFQTHNRSFTGERGVTLGTSIALR